MKYYSELLQKVYNTVEELEKAENKKNNEIAAAKAKKDAEEKQRANCEKEVREAENKCLSALKDYQEKLAIYLKKYHHYSSSSAENKEEKSDKANSCTKEDALKNFMEDIFSCFLN